MKWSPTPYENPFTRGLASGRAREKNWVNGGGPDRARQSRLLMNCTARHMPYHNEAKKNAPTSHVIHGCALGELSFIRFGVRSSFIVTTDRFPEFRR